MTLLKHIQIKNPLKQGGNRKSISALALMTAMALAMPLASGISAVYADTESQNTKPILAICPPAVSQPNPQSILPGGCVPIPINSKMILNGKVIELEGDFKPYRSISGEFMVPVKRVAQELGMTVTWKAAEKAVEVRTQDQSVLIPITGQSMTKVGEREYHTDLIEGRLFMPHWIFSELFGSVVTENDQGQIVMDGKHQLLDEASTVGSIEDVIQGKDGLQIQVKGQATGEFGLDWISLSVSRSVPVKIATGGKTETADSGFVLKKGDRVYVEYNKAVTRSLPAMGQTVSITVLKDCNLMTGKIYQISKTQSPSKGADDQISAWVIGSSDYILHLDPKVVIKDQMGQAMKAGDLKEGQLVRAYTAEFSTMSIPAQTTVYRLEIIK